MSNRVNNVVLTTTTTGNGATYALGAALPNANGQSALINGESYTIEVIDQVGSVAMWELIDCVYSSASGGTFARLAGNVIDGSSGPGVLVTWGAGTKNISVVCSAQELGIMAQALSNKPPGQDILILSTGQSLCGTFGPYTNQGVIPPANPRVLDWSFTAADHTSIAWRPLTLADDYTASNASFSAANNGITLGLPRYSGGLYRGHMAYALAKLLQAVTGRTVRVINVWKPAIAIDDATGWGWGVQTGSYATANCGEHLKMRVAAALAALPASQAGLTPDIMVMIQGETDLFLGKTAAKYGWQLCDYFRGCEDPARFGITTRHKTLYFAPELNNDFRRKNAKNAWNGQKYARALFGERLTVVHAGQNNQDTGNTWDDIHLTGEVHDIIGGRMAKALITPAGAQQDTAVFEVRKNPVVIPTSSWAISVNDGTPTAALCYHRTNGLSIALHDAAFLSPPFGDGGWKNLRAGDVFTATQTNTPSKQFVYRASGSPTLSGSVWTVPCTWVAVGGGVDSGAMIGMTSLVLTASLDDGLVTQIDSDYGSSRHVFAASPKRSPAFRNVAPVVDDYGVVRRIASGAIPDIIAVAHTSGAVTAPASNLYTFPFNANSSLMQIDFEIGARVADTSANFYYNKFTNMIWYRNAAGVASILQQPTAGTAYNPTTWLTTAPTFFYDSGVGTFHVRCVGVAAKEIDYTIRVKITEILMP